MISLLEEELMTALELVREAGAVILEVRDQKQSLLTVPKTGDHPSQGDSPVTIADVMSNEIIVSGLHERFPSHALLSEELLEEHTAEEWWKANEVWYIDPLGGTKNFIEGSDDFGVYLGLAKAGVPVLGVYYFPAKNLIYWAIKGKGAFKQQGSHPIEKLVRSSSKNILPLKLRYLDFPPSVYDALNVDLSISTIGCFGQTLCAIAEGPWNLFMFDGKKGGLWDLIPGEVILSEMGCIVTDIKGDPIDYLRSDASLSGGVIVSGSRQIHSKALQALNPSPP